MYSKLIQEKKFPWGGRLFATKYPTDGLDSVAGSILGGSRLSGSDEFSKIHSEMLLEGTKLHSKKEIQILLDDIGASLSFDFSNERLSWKAQVRATHLSKLLSLISEMLREPSFPREELAILKQREEANLSLEEQEPNDQAKIGITRLIYKEGHPNRFETVAEERAALKKVSSNSLAEFHTNILNRTSLILSFAGDITLQKASSLTQEYFAALPNKKIATKKFAPAKIGAPKRSVTTIKEKASITYIAGIATGITSEHKDYPALMLGIEILGHAGGFSGRLMKTVREKEGLTYGTYSMLQSMDSQTDGYAQVWATFAPQLFEKGRDALMREVKSIVADGVTEEEVLKHANAFDARLKVSMNNSWAFAAAAHGIGTEGRAISYLNQFPKRVLKLTKQDVDKALRRYLIPEKLNESAAGPINSF